MVHGSRRGLTRKAAPRPRHCNFPTALIPSPTGLIEAMLYLKPCLFRKPGERQSNVLGGINAGAGRGAGRFRKEANFGLMPAKARKEGERQCKGCLLCSSSLTVVQRRHCLNQAAERQTVGRSLANPVQSLSGSPRDTGTGAGAGKARPTQPPWASRDLC